MSLDFSPTVNHVHPPYWDVFPKEIRVSLSNLGGAIPLSIRGQVTAPIFESSNPSVVSVDGDGRVLVGSSAGNAMIMVWASGEKKSLRHVSVEVRDPSWFETNPDFNPSTPVVRVVGRVIDALSTNGIPGALVVLRSDPAGPVLMEATADSQGGYVANLPQGTYHYDASADGYIATIGTLTVSQSGVSGQNIALSPVLVGQVGRIVLQWGETPDDLDAHLWGPKASGERFHVYYDHQEEPDCAQLDVDDTTAFGPETVTILEINPGTYRYLIHNFTSRTSQSSTVLAESGATVTLYLKDGGQQSFSVPNQPGTVWHVFDMDGDTGVITPINAMSYESEPENVGS